MRLDDRPIRKTEKKEKPGDGEEAEGPRREVVEEAALVRQLPPQRRSLVLLREIRGNKAMMQAEVAVAGEEVVDEAVLRKLRLESCNRNWGTVQP